MVKEMFSSNEMKKKIYQVIEKYWINPERVKKEYAGWIIADYRGLAKDVTEHVVKTLKSKGIHPTVTAWGASYNIVGEVKGKILKSKLHIEVKDVYSSGHGYNARILAVAFVPEGSYRAEKTVYLVGKEYSYSMHPSFYLVQAKKYSEFLKKVKNLIDYALRITKARLEVKEKKHCFVQLLTKELGEHLKKYGKTLKLFDSREQEWRIYDTSKRIVGILQHKWQDAFDFKVVVSDPKYNSYAVAKLEIRYLKTDKAEELAKKIATTMDTVKGLIKKLGI